MQIKSFQDLNIWKEAHELTLKVYKISGNFPKAEAYGLTSQLQRAAVSIPANIVEGMGRNTTKELLSFTYNARGSLMEVIYYLILCKDLNYIKRQDFEELFFRYNGLARGINSFISKLKIKT